MATSTQDILERLIAFDTVSARTNLPLVDYAEALLNGYGFETMRFPDPDEPKAGLLARFGPPGGGLLLSAHSDVVPTDGQRWTRDPFRLSREGDRFFGRGTTDMKGFLAAMLSAAGRAARRPARAPLALLISYDEEVGCRGLTQMMERLRPHLGHPRLAVVGEPTEMRVALGHKGKRAWRAVMTGQAGHSAAAPRFVSALHMAGDLMTGLRSLQDEVARTGPREVGYAVPHATVHVGTLSGGRALNLVPERAEMTFEIRHLPSDDPAALCARIEAQARILEKTYGPAGTVALEPLSSYPAFSAGRDAETMARTLIGTDSLNVDYGTEAGLLAAERMPVIICGPGSMDEQGHKPDESIHAGQLNACDTTLDRLIAKLVHDC